MLDLYEAIDDDAALAQLSGSVAAACGGRSASVLHFSDGGERHLMQVHYFSPEQLKLYEEHLSEEDPWRNQIAVLGLQRGVINFDDVLPREEYLRSTFYNEMFRAMGDDTGRAMGVAARVGPAILSVGVHRPLGGRSFSATEMARLGEVFVHVRRIAHVRCLFAAERARARRLETLVAASGVAMLIVDRKLKVVCASPAAFACLDARDGLACHGGALWLCDREAQLQLCAAVAIVDRTPLERSGLACRRPSFRPAYRLLVLPAGAEGRDGALILVDDPAATAGGDVRRKWIAEAYALTRAESALAECLLEGLTPQEIADKRGVTIETVRTQLKSLLMKTETHRQIDLLALLSRLPRL